MPFEKGKSGNPSGRPKEDNEVRKLAREYGREALDRLVYWMRQDEAKPSVSASNAILDRGFGKPAQMIIGDPEQPVELKMSSHYTNDDLLALKRHIDSLVTETP